MASRYSNEHINLIKRMRLLERELSELRSRVRMYESMYQQSSNRIVAVRQRYVELHGDSINPLIDEDPDYRRALERMNRARWHLENLRREREVVSKKVQDLMYRSQP